MALLRAVEAIEKGIKAGVLTYKDRDGKEKSVKCEGDIKVGASVIKRALEEPFRQIVINAGLEGSVVLNQVKLAGGTKGFDARNEEVVDMIDSGIIDPAEVTKQALLNAASIAGLMLTTEALVSEIKEDDKKDSGGGAQGMGGMY